MPELPDSIANFIGSLKLFDQVTIVLVGVFLVAVFTVWSLNPWRALIAWMATFSIQFSAGTFHFSISDLFLLPLALGTFAWWITRKEKLIGVPTSVLVFVFLFLTLGNFVTAFTLGKLPQWTWLNKDLGLIALLVPYACLLLLCRDMEKTERLLKTFLTSVSIVNAVGVCLYIASLFTGIGEMVNYDGMRFKGFMLDPNGYAGLAGSMAILQFAILNLSPRQGRKVRFLEIANCCFLAAGCILTLSRGGCIALVVGMLAFLYFIRAKSSFTIVFALIAIAGGLFWLVGHADLNESIQRRADDRGNIESRIDYMEQGMRMYLSSPRTLITGIGIGTFIDESPKYFGDMHQIHNTYVWLLVEGGPLLFMAYLFLLYRALSNCLRVYRRTPQFRYAAAGCFCALTTTLVWSMTVEGMYHHHFWILLGLSELFWVHSRPRQITFMRPTSSPTTLQQQPAIAQA